MMKRKVIFISSIGVYFLTTLIGLKGHAYYDATSWQEVQHRYIFWIILLSISIGITVFILFKKLYPVGYEKQSSGGLIGILFIFLTLPIPLTMWNLFFVNGLYSGKSVMINGYIKKKFVERTGRAKSFYVIVRDTAEKKITNWR